MHKKILAGLLGSLIAGGVIAQTSTQTNTSGTNFNSTTTYAAGSGSSTTVQSAPSTQTVKSTGQPVPPVISTGGNDSCLIPIAGGVGLPGISLSGGSTISDPSCIILKHSQRLSSIGFTDASLAVLLQQKENLEAIKLVNPEIYLRYCKDQLSIVEAKNLVLIRLKETDVEVEKQLKYWRTEAAVTELRLLDRKIATKGDKQ